MSHARKQIRAAVKSLLGDSRKWRTVLETRVATSRNIWPFVLVYCDGEPVVNTLVQNPNVQERTMSLIVTVFTKVPTDKEKTEDDFDDIAIDIEEKITEAALRTKLGGAVNIMLSLEAQSFTILVDDEDTISHAELIFSYNVQYYTTEGAPEVIL